jgi:cobalamin biosynthesis Mg chelatase CobN
MSKHTDILLEAVQEIAEIIYMEMPLRYQDIWLERVMEKGIWKPDPEIIEGAYQKTLEAFQERMGACCRNGCEKCEK